MPKAKGLTEKLLLKPDQRVRLVGAPPGQAALFGASVARGRAAAAAVVLYAKGSAALRADLTAVLQSLEDGARLWVCYPKARQLGTDLDRDTLAAALLAHGYQAVRLVSVDAVWSAMAFKAGA